MAGGGCQPRTAAYVSVAWKWVEKFEFRDS